MHCCHSIGEPPLTRGTRLGGRLTPACTGKTPPASPKRCSFQAHPRLHGENYRVLARPDPEAGTPPLARGTQELNCVAGPGRRHTPACTGKTSQLCPGRSRATAHPRLHGENPRTSARFFTLSGTPPLARGKHRPRARHRRRCRHTPACTGKTMPGGIRWYPRSAHPRLHGENWKTTRRRNGTTGTPPLARGKP